MSGKCCSVEGCGGVFYGLGYCEKHYQRVRQRGSTEDSKGHHVSLDVKFFRNVDKSDGCWVWTGPTYKGYGRVFTEGKTIRAHRASWMLTNGEIPEGLFVLHKCDNPSCVNPDHLYLGTHKDNMKDKVERGRCARPDRRGEKSGRALLTEAAVLSIRADARTCRVLALEYGVDRSTISDIRRRKTWTNI